MAGPVDLSKRGDRDLPELVDLALDWLRDVAPDLSWDRLTEIPKYAEGAGAANETIIVNLPVTRTDGKSFDGLAPLIHGDLRIAGRK